MESKKRLNILILSWRGPGHPQAGGAEISTHEHAKGWVKAGHNVTLFTSFHPGAKKEDIIDRVKIIRKGSQNFGVKVEAFKWYLFSRRPKFDLVIDQFHGIPFFTPLFVKEKKLAFIHEVAKEVWGLNPWHWPFSLAPKVLGPVFEPLIFKFYRNIPFMTVSNSTRIDLIDFGIAEKNITVIHNGLNPPGVKCNSLKEKKKTLIFLGALSKDKGIEDALQVFSMLNSADSDFKFWIVGKGESHYLKNLKLQTIELKIDKKVKFWGFVDEEKKFELLRRAHLLINPSVREGWGLVVMEAACVGTPTVAFNVPGLRDSVLDGKTGILCGSLQQMVVEIGNLLNNESRFNEISRNAIIWSKDFSWEESIYLSLNLIKKLVNYRK